MTTGGSNASTLLSLCKYLIQTSQHSFNTKACFYNTLTLHLAACLKCYAGMEQRLYFYGVSHLRSLSPRLAMLLDTSCPPSSRKALGLLLDLLG